MKPDLIQKIYQGSLAVGLAAGAAMESLTPQSKPANMRVGTGRATFCGDGSPLTQVSWLAFESDFDPKEIDDIESFFKGRASTWEYNLTPYSDPKLLPALIERGWSDVQYENSMWRDLGDLSDVPVARNSKIEVRPASASELRTFIDVSMRGFFGDEIPPACATIGDIVMNSPGTIPFLALIDGRPAGAATVSVFEDTVYLGGAATLPEFRGQGVQTALLAYRLAHAAGLGCDLALCECLPGSQSQRNQERAGFRVAYSKIVLTGPKETD